MSLNLSFGRPDAEDQGFGEGTPSSSSVSNTLPTLSNGATTATTGGPQWCGGSDGLHDSGGGELGRWPTGSSAGLRTSDQRDEPSSGIGAR